MLNKNEEYIVEVIDQGMEGEGIAKIDNFTVFIPGAIKGEKVKIVITKVLSSFSYARLLEIIEKSEMRQSVDCTTYKQCGGCNLRHIKYEETLRLKTDKVKNCLKKSVNEDINVNQCIGMERPYGYRNKLQYPIGQDKNGDPIMGVYAERTHNIIKTEKCLIQDELSQKIANEILCLIKKYDIKPYNENDGTGTIRHVIIRKGKNTEQIMITLVSNKEQISNEKKLIQELTQKFKEIKTIVKNINSQNTNVILGNKTHVLYGDGFIEDYLGEFKFRISPESFYQVNPMQTEILYNTAIKFAKLSGNEIVFDLYCGIGTIGIFASKMAKKVFGIEAIPQAIDNARENANINNIKNCEFMVGEVENVLPQLTQEHNADVVFIDPPRKGCEQSVLETLIRVEPKKIIYISCNPATLARDLAILKEKYNIIEIQPVDMFPWTSHCEAVSVLRLK